MVSCAVRALERRTLYTPVGGETGLLWVRARPAAESVCGRSVCKHRTVKGLCDTEQCFGDYSENDSEINAIFTGGHR